MTHEKFTQLIEELDKQGASTLAQKNKRYSSKNDALLNFKNGAEISGNTMAQTCWMYLTKHLAALRKMVQEDNFTNREDFLEKCQDSINYIRFLWAIGNNDIERIEKQKSTPPFKTFPQTITDPLDNMPCIPTPHYPCEAVTGVAEDVKIYNAPQDITGTLKADNNNDICLD